jgi:putative flippase GtrA
LILQASLEVKKILKFAAVGCVNTAVGALIMFGLYNAFHVSYWVSSATSYIIAGAVSYFLNKSFTFKSDNSILSSGVRFIISSVVCYFIAYSVAQPVINMLVGGLPDQYRGNIALFTGMVLYTILNFFSQRFFVFRDQNKRGI